MRGSDVVMLGRSCSSAARPCLRLHSVPGVTGSGRRFFSEGASLGNAPSASAQPPPPNPGTSPSDRSSNTAVEARSQADDSGVKLPRLDGPGFPWEDAPNWNIKAFSELPYKHFGVNQHMLVNEEFKESLRQILWQFKAPIRYAFAYGSGVFSQSTGGSTGSLSPHPNPPEAIEKWQKNGGKMIDFIFGVTYSDHWHSLNLAQHGGHYSFLGSLGMNAVSKIQDRIGAGVYFNPYITVNGTLIKYGVVNLDTIRRDLRDWDTLYIAGRLQKPVKILRDDPRIRLANQMNLISAVRAAMLQLPERFAEDELYQKIAGISYNGDIRMSKYTRSENPNKVANIVTSQLGNFRQLYDPIVQDLPNIDYHGGRSVLADWQPGMPPEAVSEGLAMEQDMDPRRRANMVRRLPSSLRARVYRLYQARESMSTVELERLADDGIGGDTRDATELDRRIVEQGPELVSEMVGKAVGATVAWPSRMQSIKGVFTAGLGRSWRYLAEKRAKGR